MFDSLAKSPQQSASHIYMIQKGFQGSLHLGQEALNGLMAKDISTKLSSLYKMPLSLAGFYLSSKEAIKLARDKEHYKAPEAGLFVYCTRHAQNVIPSFGKKIFDHPIKSGYCLAILTKTQALIELEENFL